MNEEKKEVGKGYFCIIEVKVITVNELNETCKMMSNSLLQRMIRILYPEPPSNWIKITVMRSDEGDANIYYPYIEEVYNYIFDKIGKIVKGKDFLKDIDLINLRNQSN